MTHNRLLYKYFIRHSAYPLDTARYLWFTSDKGIGKCFCRVCLFVCLSVRPPVCLLARLLKSACMDLDEMLRVDRCRDTDELINFWARSHPDAGTGLLSPRYRISAAKRNFIRRENLTYSYMYWRPVAAARRRFTMVLFTAIRRNTFVGGTCALPSALFSYIWGSSRWN